MDSTDSQRRKTAEQVAFIVEVQRATEVAMDAVISYLRNADSPTSERAHKIIDEILAEHDCESPERHIVASGIQSAEPHEEGSGVIAKGVPIVIDIYPRSKKTGYFADMSRTVCIGEPSFKLQNMYDAVLKAQELAISMIAPHRVCSDIQEAVDAFFTEAGYVTSGKGVEFSFAEGFVHGLGHGVGRQIHEVPKMSRKSSDILEEGDVVTIEPGLYYKNVGGIRIEDMLLVTSMGSQNLTQYPKQFEI